MEKGCDIIIYLQVKAAKLLGFAVQRSQHHDGHLRLPANHLTYAEAIYFRQHDIQQNKVEGAAVKLFYGLHAVARRRHLVPRVAQVGAEQLLNILFILYYQYLFQESHPKRQYSTGMEIL